MRDGNQRILVRERDGYLEVVLNRPQARNAIDVQLVTELHEVCARLESSPNVLVITGAEGMFAAGADIGELRDRGIGDALRGINSRLFERIANLPLATIAAIDGPAIGGGAELAYACDFRLVTARAKFANPEVGLGIIAGAGATWRLRDLVGLSVATDVLLGGRVLSGEEALRFGLVTELVDPDELDRAVDGLVARVRRGSEDASRLTKLALKAPRSSHPLIDEVSQAVLFQTAEKRERMDRFLKGRDQR